MVNMHRVAELKRELYVMLLHTNKNNLTDSEVDIMFVLSKDEDIQSVLQRSIDKIQDGK